MTLVSFLNLLRQPPSRQSRNQNLEDSLTKTSGLAPPTADIPVEDLSLIGGRTGGKWRVQGLAQQGPGPLDVGSSSVDCVP